MPMGTGPCIGVMYDGPDSRISVADVNNRHSITNHRHRYRPTTDISGRHLRRDTTYTRCISDRHDGYSNATVLSSHDLSLDLFD